MGMVGIDKATSCTLALNDGNYFSSSALTDYFIQSFRVRSRNDIFIVLLYYESSMQFLLR